METNNSEYKIEKGVPIPEKHSRYGPLASAICKMEVGDSVLVKGKSPGWISGTLNNLQKRKGVKITCRTQPDGSVRVWRIA